MPLIGRSRRLSCRFCDRQPLDAAHFGPAPSYMTPQDRLEGHSQLRCALMRTRQAKRSDALPTRRSPGKFHIEQGLCFWSLHGGRCGVDAVAGGGDAARLPEHGERHERQGRGECLRFAWQVPSHTDCVMLDVRLRGPWRQLSRSGDSPVCLHSSARPRQGIHIASCEEWFTSHQYA